MGVRKYHRRVYQTRERMIYHYMIWIATIFILAGFCETNNDRETRKPKILILGAGMSGITVAKSLEQAGHHNFLVIEGSSRVGGRMKSEDMSGHTVAQGAMWVYGAGTNPVYKMLNDYNVSLVEEYPDTWTVRDTSGNDVTRMADEAQSRYDKALESLDVEAKQTVRDGLSDFNYDSRLRFHDWRAETEVEDAVEAYNVDFEFGVPPEYLSGKHGYVWAPFEQFDSEDMPIINDPRGYEVLVENIADTFTQNTIFGNRIAFDKVIKKVIQTSDGVDVLTLDGTHYHGDYAVVTFSIGVLQNRKVTFAPKFPSCKQMAIDKFGICPFTHIYMKFPSSFWDDTMYILFASEQRGKYSVYTNMNYIHPGSNILQLSTWGEESRRIERLDDETIVDDILRHLRIMYPNNVIPFPDNFTISRWTYDPLTYGAYSYWPTGFTRDNMADMMAPFGRVYFAGEHIDPVQYSYVHGAFASGVRTAKEVLACIETPELCFSEVDDFGCSQTGHDDSCVSGTGFVFLTTRTYFLRWSFMLVALSCVFVLL